MRKLLRTAAIICLALAPAAALAMVSLGSSVSKREVTVGESFTFTMRVQGLRSPIQQPSLPAMEGASVKGQYQTTETGQGGAAYLYHYIISPSKAGTIRLPEFSIKIEGQNVRVQGFEVRVAEGPAPAPAESQSARKVEAGDVMLEGRLSKEKVFEGEAVVYTLHLLTRESVRNFEFVRKADFDGFRKIELPSAKYPSTVKVTRGGRVFLDAPVLKCILFPLRNGTLRIASFTAAAKVQASGSSTVQAIRLEGGSAGLEVAPLPKPPEKFRGAVGSFTVQLEGQGAVTTRLNEPFEIDVSIAGEGSLPGEPLFVSKSPFFTEYPSRSEDATEEKDGGLRVRRKIVLSFAPVVSGKRNPPEVWFTYFDTSRKVYAEVPLKLPQVDVAEGSSGTSAAAAPEILPPIPLTGTEQSRGKGPEGRWAWILLLPFVVTIAVHSLSAFIEKLFLSPEKIRVRKLTLLSMKEFKNARGNLDARKSREFHSHMRKSLQAYLEMRIGEPVASLTADQIAERLSSTGAGAAEVGEIASLLGEIDSAEFSNAKVQKTELKKRLARLGALIGKKKSGAALLLLLLPVILLSQQAPTLLAGKAAAEYSNGNFEAALKYFKVMEDSGARSGALCYNIGNCYLETGRVPQAILYFKRALKLDDGLNQARTNLALAEKLVPARSAPYEPSPLVSFLVRADRRVLFYLALLLSLAANALFCAVRLFGLFGSRQNLLRTGYALTVLFAVAGSMFVYGARLTDSFREAVVLSKTPVYSKPDPSSRMLVAIPEGSSVYIVGDSGSWARIKWGEGEGWAQKTGLGVP